MDGIYVLRLYYFKFVQNVKNIFNFTLYSILLIFKAFIFIQNIPWNIYYFLHMLQGRKNKCIHIFKAQGLHVNLIGLFTPIFELSCYQGILKSNSDKWNYESYLFRYKSIELQKRDILLSTYMMKTHNSPD